MINTELTHDPNETVFLFQIVSSRPASLFPETIQVAIRP
jgi:hypothetical protein